MQTPNVGIERVGAVLCVTFDRPDKKNALNRAMYVAATQALRDAGGDLSIGAWCLQDLAGCSRRATTSRIFSLLLLRIHQDHWLLRRQDLSHALVDMGELRIPVFVAVTLFGLPVAL